MTTKFALNIVITFIISSAFSQNSIGHIPLLLKKSEPEVISYFDSLNGLKSNPYYKIERDVTNSGDLLLKVEFSLADESFYNCNTIMATFYRLKDGTEVCIDQIIAGSVEYVEPNLNYLKSNFEQVGDHWEWNILPQQKIKIIGTFKRMGEPDSKYPMYAIEYYVQPE